MGTRDETRREKAGGERGQSLEGARREWERVELGGPVRAREMESTHTGKDYKQRETEEREREARTEREKRVGEGEKVCAPGRGGGVVANGRGQFGEEWGAARPGALYYCLCYGGLGGGIRGDAPRRGGL